MKRMSLLVALLLVMCSSVCYAAPQTIDLEKMSAAELQQLRDDVDTALSLLEAAPSNDQTNADAIAITADELNDAYNGNKLAADKKFKGKTLLVSGVISSIDQTMFGDDLYISLRAGGDYSFRSITCYFGADQIDTLADLELKSTITIIGTCDGDSMTSVVLKNCSIVE